MRCVHRLRSEFSILNLDSLRSAAVDVVHTIILPRVESENDNQFEYYGHFAIIAYIYIKHIPFVTVMCFDAANINVWNMIATKYHILISSVYLQKSQTLRTKLNKIDLKVMHRNSLLDANRTTNETQTFNVCIWCSVNVNE